MDGFTHVQKRAIPDGVKRYLFSDYRQKGIVQGLQLHRNETGVKKLFA